jgi:hypothetical protein
MADPSEDNPNSSQAETKKKLHWLEIGYFTSQIGLAIIGIWALTIYHGQLLAMQSQLDEMGKQSAEIHEQTTLQRQQLVGTQAANIIVSEPSWSPSTQTLEISLSNTNQAAIAGTVINFSAEAQRKEWANGKSVGVPLRFVIENPIILPKNTAHTMRVRPPWTMPDVNNDWSRWPGPEFLTMQGSYIYDNGFGEKFTGKFGKNIFG